MNLWGKKKEAPKINESIMLLRDALQTLEKREKHLGKQMDSTMIDARAKAAAKDKRGALFQLKRKKMFEKEVEQIYGKRLNIETQINALESAASSADVLKAMLVGKDALVQVMKETNVERIDDLMDEVNDSIGMVDEVSQAMSQQIGPALDESDLERELAELESLVSDEALLGLTEPVKLPAAALAQPQRVQPAAIAASSVSLADAPSVPRASLLASAPAVPERRPEIAASKSREDEELDALSAELGL